MDGNYIKELGKDAFASAGLINLQKISMKNCQIQKIHEDAFSKLNILMEVNLGRRSPRSEWDKFIPIPVPF